MQLSTLFSAAALVASVSAVSVSYDQGYDNAGRSLTAISCSDGPNGLMTKHPSWTTQGNIPRFPYIGGADIIAGWNSPECGSCWRLEYKGKVINVLAVDRASPGFNLALGAMNALTGGQAVKLGRIDVKATRANVRDCGL